MGARALTARRLGMLFVWWVLLPFAVVMEALTIVAVFDLDDMWTYHYANPTNLERVTVLEEPGHLGARPRVQEDFDGDCVPDRFEFEYFRMRAWGGEGTCGLLRLYSGLDGAEILAFPTAMPFAEVCWLGDIDGDGTDDLCVENGGQPSCLTLAR